LAANQFAFHANETTPQGVMLLRLVHADGFWTVDRGGVAGCLRQRNRCLGRVDGRERRTFGCKRGTTTPLPVPSFPEESRTKQIACVRSSIGATTGDTAAIDSAFSEVYDDSAGCTPTVRAYKLQRRTAENRLGANLPPKRGASLPIKPLQRLVQPAI
jgi:hypothetical protein